MGKHILHKLPKSWLYLIIFQRFNLRIFHNISKIQPDTNWDPRGHYLSVTILVQLLHLPVPAIGHKICILPLFHDNSADNIRADSITGSTLPSPPDWNKSRHIFPSFFTFPLQILVCQPFCSSEQLSGHVPAKASPQI